MAGSNATKGVFGELAKRVPLNQLKQFKSFIDLNAKYIGRVNKFPERLPLIDWDYYRTNVRTEAIKMVDEFEKKYEDLNKVFDERNKLDTKKYYDELEKQRAVVQAQVKQYIAESNERIKAYEAEITRLCTMKPYSSMTMEEFINLRPECAAYIPHGRKPLFWPHDSDEQTPGPVGIPKPDDGDKGGGGDDSGGGHPVISSDIKSKADKFEFTPSETEKSTKPPEVKVSPASKAVNAKAHQQVATKPETGTEKAAEPQIHIDKPTSEEFKKKLDPCSLMGKQEQQAAAKALPELHSPTDKAVPCAAATSKASQPSEGKGKAKTEVKPSENKAEPHKKQHPCDLAKIGGKKEAVAKEVEPCKGAPKGPYKDEKATSCVFADPCKVKFGAGIKSDVKAAEKAPVKEKSEGKGKVKTEVKTSQKKAEPQKKQHPCDLVKIGKKKEAYDKEVDPCKGASKGPYKDEKATSCVFADPCKVKFGAGIKSDVKEAEKAPVKEKTTVKAEPKETRKELKQQELKKKAVTEKDPCESATKKGPLNDEKTGTCMFVNPCKSGSEKRVAPEKPVIKQVKSKTETKSSSTCQSAAPKDTKKVTKPSEETKKPKGEQDMVKDEDSCTMVFAEPKDVDKVKKLEKISSDSCARTPYYNPFRSDEENKVKEEMCDESEESDPCGDEEHSKDKDHYNPCKDEKEKK